MYVRILREAGYEEAILGLSLSFNTDNFIRLKEAVAPSLSDKDGGHNKFLESIAVWVDVNMPRYWWQEFDTYRVGVTKQSESTMHTLMRSTITQDMFSHWINPVVLDLLEDMRERGDFLSLKRHLPESFLQRRIIATNYATIRRIISQREGHKLKEEWTLFITTMRRCLEHKELLN